MAEGTDKNKDGIKVSIVIPVYNVSDYIERCVKSVMSQTYANIECILVDDVTPDNSIEIFNSLVADYKGPIVFKVLRHEKNRGLSAARNTGTDVATGDYIYYLDSDDEITKDCISLLVGNVLNHPGIEMVQGGIVAIPYQTHYDINPFKEIDYIEDNVWLRRHYYTFGKVIPLNAWGKLIKLSFIKEYTLFFKEGLLYEDEHWMFFVVKVLQKYGFVHRDTYIHYGGTTGSIMTTSTLEKKAYHWSIIFDDIISNLDFPEYQPQLLRYLDRFVVYYGNKGKVSYNKLIKEFRQVVLKQRFYIIYILLVMLQITFPLIKGKGIRYLIYKQCYSKWEKITCKYQ